METFMKEALTKICKNTERASLFLGKAIIFKGPFTTTMLPTANWFTKMAKSTLDVLKI